MKFRILLPVAAAAIAVLSSCSHKPAALTVTPYPNDVTIKCGTFNAAGADFAVDPALDPDSRDIVVAFASQLSAVSGHENTLLEGTAATGFTFVLDTALDPEAYSLEINRKSVSVKASSTDGFRYAVQTLRQMLPVEIFGKTPAPDADWTLQCCTVNDAPRFGYRGLHLDVSRHFYDLAVVKKIIDLQEIYKMNTLHWHLTDDQGWRIEIKKYPRLTEVGGWRKGTMIRKEWTNFDGIPYGGYYTQDEIREVVSYARSKGITVIPEIDLPGHMLAALAAYPELGCTGGPYEVWQRWGVSDDVLCVGNEKTFSFLQDVLDEVLELFPSEYIHIGGDECPKTKWADCPKCQARIRQLGLKDDEKFQAEHYLQSYVTARIEKYLNGKGRQIIGWDEILEGELSPNATVMSWRGSEGGIAAAKAGHDAIRTPHTHFYFDYYQSNDTANEPLAIGGYLPIETVYNYEPFTDEMDENARAHIKGVQANVWTEYISTKEHLEYMILPRAAALAEVQWTLPQNKDLNRFLSDMGRAAKMYDTMGYNYAKTVFEVMSNVKVNEAARCVEVRLTTVDNATVRYTTDGSEPTSESAICPKVIKVTKGCTIKAAAFRENGQTRTITLNFKDNKALARPVVLNTEPMGKYKYDAPESLVDGLPGSKVYTSGEWAGWYGTPVELTIEMDGKTEYSSVEVSALTNKGDYIFNPLDLVVSVSDDNKEFTEVARAEYQPEGPEIQDGVKEYKVTFPQTRAKYIRVNAKTVASIPEWHGARGRKGFCFVSEVIVL